MKRKILNPNFKLIRPKIALFQELELLPGKNGI